MQKVIYFERKPLYLADTVTPEIEEFLHHEETIFIDEFNIHTVKTMIHEMEQPRVHRGVFLHHNVEELMASMKKKMVPVYAAGGLITSPAGEILFIFRRGKWDLPKGKQDAGETAEACALRECTEETGLQQLKTGGELLTTWHSYHEQGRHMLKETHWFHIHSGSRGPLLPQSEEGIEKCEWVRPSRADEYLENTHASLVAVIRKGIGKAGEGSGDQ